MPDEVKGSTIGAVGQVLAGSLGGGSAVVLSEPPALNSIGGSLYLPTVVGAGVDTSYHNLAVEVGALEAKREELEAWKQAAQANEDDRVYRVPGLDLFMAPRGRGHYEYILTCPAVGEVMVNYHPRFKGARVRLYSSYLFGCATFADAASAAVGLVEQVFGVGAVQGEQLGELHVYLDFFGWVPRLSDVTGGRFTCPAHWKIEEGEQYPGDVAYSLRWGKRGGASLQARLYDKPKEIREQSGKTYLLDSYRAAGWSEDGGSVYRLEFAFSREWLRDRGLERVADVDLAAVLSEGMCWLQLRDVVATDSNNRRWPLAALWLELERQGVQKLGEVRQVCEKVYQPRPSLDMLAAQILGCVAGVGALTGCDDLGDLLSFLQAHGERRLERQGRTFADMVSSRRDRYLLVDAP